VLLEALELAERIQGLEFGKDADRMDVSQVPWSIEKVDKKTRELVSLPGRSLHWTDFVSMDSEGVAEQPL